MGFMDGGISGAIGMAGNIAQSGQQFSAANTARGYNSREARKNRDFQRQQRATQYQAATRDMKKAGINPMLAYMQGGAGTSSGAQASTTAQDTTNVLEGVVSTALETKKLNQDLKNLKAIEKETKARTKKTATETKHLKETLPEATVRGNAARGYSNIVEKTGDFFQGKATSAKMMQSSMKAKKDYKNSPAHKARLKHLKKQGK